MPTAQQPPGLLILLGWALVPLLGVPEVPCTAQSAGACPTPATRWQQHATGCPGAGSPCLQSGRDGRHLRTFPMQVILSEASSGSEVPFFETWMQTCMPEEGKILNPDHPCFRPDSTKVESLVALLNNSSEMKLVSVRGTVGRVSPPAPPVCTPW